MESIMPRSRPNFPTRAPIKGKSYKLVLKNSSRAKDDIKIGNKNSNWSREVKSEVKSKERKDRSEQNANLNLKKIMDN